MSDLRVATISDVAGTGPVDLYMQSAAKAWANINHDTVTVNSSFNLSSFTDNAAGDGTINYTSSLSAANFALHSDGKTDDDNTDSTGNRVWVRPYHSYAANGSYISTDSGGTERDAKILCMSSLGDLA
jgi:hypothetical protein